MELAKFIKLLLKRWYVLLFIPFACMVMAWYFVRKMPGTYRSQAKISTGLVDETQRVLNNNEGNAPPESQINQEFSNLIEMMKLKKIIDQISYELIIHDLTQAKPYKPASKLLLQLTPDARKHALEVYKKKLAGKDELNLNDPDQNGLFKVLKSMGYDEESIKGKLTIYRLTNSDFIYVEFSSEDPDMSAFVVNELCRIFLEYYTNAVKENQFKAASYLQNLMNERYRTMNDKINALKAYKIDNKILNLYEQSKIVYTHLMLVSSQRDDAQKNIESYEGAIRNINNKFDPKDRSYLEASMTDLNGKIVTTKQQLRNLSDRYIQSNFDERYKRSIDSVQGILTNQISQLTDKYIYDPLNTKKDLIGQKLSLEVQRDISRHSLAALNTQLNELNAKFNKLVPYEAVVQSYERDIDLATREYLEVVTKFNQTNMESGFSVRLRQVQLAMPGTAEASKKMILILLAGIVSFIFCLLVFFIIFLLDKSITRPTELAQKTQQPVLGNLKYLPITGAATNLFETGNGKGEEEQKKQVRSIRFETDQAVEDNHKVICVSSLNKGEGKTYLAVQLAYAFALMKKKVLLVDGNFSNPVITQSMPVSLYVEDVFGGQFTGTYDAGKLVTVAGNRGVASSLLEINTEDQVGTIMKHLPYDIVLVETESLDTENKAKEWLLFATQVISVFESGGSISHDDEQKIAYLGSTGKFSGWVLNHRNSKT